MAHEIRVALATLPAWHTLFRDVSHHEDDAYLSYRYSHTHSAWLVLLTILDLVVAYLIWRNFQLRKLLRHTQV